MPVGRKEILMLEWANNQNYLDAFIKAGEFKNTDSVLEVGCGDGIIACAISPLVKCVMAIDKKPVHGLSGNILFVQGDILEGLLPKEKFDKITARHVFHHITANTQEAMNICYNALDEGGLMVFSEGVPPSRKVINDYKRIFALKEDRITFTVESMVSLMLNAGFREVKANLVILPHMSVKNWLSYADIPMEKKHKIFELHRRSSRTFKRAYNMVVTDNDCLIDMTMVIMTGRK
jgi:SAM-dependent methyltransferase